MSRRNHAPAVTPCQCQGPEPATVPHPTDPATKVCRACWDMITLGIDTLYRDRARRIGDSAERAQMLTNGQAVVRRAHEQDEIFWVDADGNLEALTVEQNSARFKAHGCAMPAGTDRFYVREEAEAAGRARKALKGRVLPEGLAKVADRLRGGGAIYLVDAGGAIHEMSVEAYVSLGAEQIAGSLVRFTRAGAEVAAANGIAGQGVQESKKSTGGEETNGAPRPTTPRTK